MPDLAALEHFHFLRPAWALLLVPIVALTLFQDRRQSRRDMFGGIIAPHLLEHLRLPRIDSRLVNPRSFTKVFVALVIVLLMGPSWRQQPSPLSQDESALVILLDVSSSMAQRDVQPSRLRRAKQKIIDLLALRPDKQASLIVYAGSAHTVLTLTADQEILKQYLAAIDPGIMPRPGKFPEYSLPLVAAVLRDTTAAATVVLVADGLGADSESAFIQFFDQHPHQLQVLGVGTEDPGEGMAPLERRSLEQLAAATGGGYIELTVDDRDMRTLARRIDTYYVVVQDSALPWLDSGYPLVFPAMLLFLMWFRRGWTLTWGWLLLPLVLAGAPAPVLAQDPGAVAGGARGKHTSLRQFGYALADLWLTGDQQGRLLLQWGRYREAAARFEDPLWQGMAYYYAEDFMLAAEYFSRRDTQDALFNEANARAQARDYVRAVNRYDRLLARNPDYPGARQNRTRVQALIDEINRLSESQEPEDGVSSEERQPGGDDAIPADGAQELSWQQAQVEQLTADEILQDPATSAMWLRGVQQDPSRFLAVKFGMQLQRAEDGQEVAP